MLANLFRPPPALRSWLAGHALLDRGLPTPRPLAVLHRDRGRHGFLLVEKVEGAHDLREFVQRLKVLPGDDQRHRLRSLIEQLARVIREMHGWQISHRDLKAANILVQSHDDASASIWLIDLVGVGCHRALPRKRRVQNLARLSASFLDNLVVTRTDKLRFLRTYLQWGLVGKAGWKTWWRDIVEATLKKVRHNRRTGRPLA
jgi:tRNA A-37 threonylcarbamoyl transferase component Bud32